MLSKSSLFQGLLLVPRPRAQPCPILGVSSWLLPAPGPPFCRGWPELRYCRHAED